MLPSPMKWPPPSAGNTIRPLLALPRPPTALRAGEVTSVQLTEQAIARIERDDEAINAICVRDFERARVAARRADQARAGGENRPLLGGPVTVKESYNMAGLPTTWGVPQSKDFVPAEDAIQVSRLAAAGVFAPEHSAARAADV